MTEEDFVRPRPTPADLVSRVTRLAAVPPPPSRPVIALGDDPDASLIAACVAAVDLAKRKSALFDGPGRIDDDVARDAVLDPLDTEQRPLLDAVACVVPATWTGHIARAATFLLWDAGALHHQARLGSVGERLLAAIVHDLAAS